MAKVLGTSTWKMLLWLEFWGTDLENVAVATVLVTSTWKMCLWLSSGHIKLGNVAEFEHVAVAKVLCVP